eukprot:gene7831-8467_t
MICLSLLVVLVVVSTAVADWKTSLDRILSQTEKVEPILSSNALRSVTTEANNYLNGYFSFRQYANPLGSCGDTVTYFYAIRLNKCFDIGKNRSGKATARVTTSGKLQVFTTEYSDRSCDRKKKSDSFQVPNNICTYGTHFQVISELPAEPPVHGLFTSQYESKKQCGSGDYTKAEYLELAAPGFCNDGVKVTSCHDKIKAHIYKNQNGKCEGKYKMVTQDRGCKTEDIYGKTTEPSYVKYTCV